MSAIIRYILDMLPFMLAVLPIYVTLRLLVMRRAAFNPRHEVALLVFVLFLSGLASQTILPTVRFSEGEIHVINDGVHTTNLIPLKVFADTYTEVFKNGNVAPLIINFFGNVVMFMPIGFLVPLLWRASSGRLIIIGFLCSLFVELSQLLLPRSSDVDDLILNTAGVALGLLIYKIIEKGAPGFTEKFKK